MNNLDEVRERIETKFGKVLRNTKDFDLVMSFVRLALLDQQAVFEAILQTAICFDQRIAERHQAQLVRLNEWLQENAHDLYQTNPGDSAELMIMAAERMRTECSNLRQQLVQLNADNAALIVKLATAEKVKEHEKL